MVVEYLTSVVLLFVGLVVLVIIRVCVSERTIGMTQESIGNGAAAQRSSTISEDDIKKLPWYDYKLDHDDDDASDDEVKRVECAVCLEVFKGGDKCRLLPNCRHNFHANCIDPWLVKTGSCPVCRTCVDIRKSSEAESRFTGDVYLELT